MADARIALITGASRGIGYAIAQRLAGSGYRVALTARDAERLGTCAREVEAAGGEAMWVEADLRDPNAADTVLARVTDQFGPPDVLVNNAGTAPAGKIERTSDETLAEVLDLHVAAPFRLIRGVIPQMKARDQGCVIQLASTAGLKGYPLVAAYTAAKHGMVGLTRALAAELASTAIRVCAVCPGFVDTDITRSAAATIAERGSLTEEQVLAQYAQMNACGRLLEPGEIADLVCEVADPESSVASGSIYEMDDMPPVCLK